MPSSRQYGTLVIVAHAVVVGIHSAAHIQLDIMPGPLANLFIWTVIILAPLAALGLLWSPRQREGGWLLAASMLGSLAFGFWHHFVADSHDHVSHVDAHGWGMVFTTSAVLLAILETIGVGVGLWIARQRPAEIAGANRAA